MFYNYITIKNVKLNTRIIMEEILSEFIEWLEHESGEDAFYIFDNQQEAIERFKEYMDV